MIYLSAPYSFGNSRLATVQFKAVTEFAATLITENVFSEVTYIHAFREATKDLAENLFQEDYWKRVLRSIQKNADRAIMYQLPGWQKDPRFNQLYKLFQSWDTPVTVQAPLARHLCSPYKEIWENAKYFS